MNEYKELIDNLRCMEFFCGRDGKELWATKPFEVQEADIKFHRETLLAAIDAIEGLVKYTEKCEKECEAAAKYIAKLEKDRDEWKTLGEIANKRAEDYQEMRRQRDAAIADLRWESCCWNCVNNEKCHRERKVQPPDIVCGNYEWRGMQEKTK